jgi:hypothetical protein
MSVSLRFWCPPPKIIELGHNEVHCPIPGILNKRTREETEEKGIGSPEAPT